MGRNIYIPVGMENFEASHRSSWDLIKNRIAECDYMLVLIGDNSGSYGESGVSFTEMEYDYAMKINVPTAVLLKKDFQPRASSAKELRDAKNVLNFRKKCEKNHNIRYWSTPDELADYALAALEALVRGAPRSGLVRGRDALSDVLFNLLDRAPHDHILSGEWSGYFIERENNQVRIIEESVVIEYDEGIYRGVHRCLSEKEVISTCAVLSEMTVWLGYTRFMRISSSMAGFLI